MENLARTLTTAPSPSAPTATEARLRAFTPFSLCDWPGRSVSVIYLGGCNLRCPTCHNQSLAFTPEKHPELDRNNVMRTLTQRSRWLDGVVVCGGEPTLDHGLPNLVGRLTGLGLPVKVDTNGMLPGVVEHILALHPGTIFAVDVKGPWERYPELTGGATSPEAARAALKRIFALAEARPGSFFFRTTLVPGLAPEDVRRVRECLPPGHELTEQTYIPPKSEGKGA
ncbi:radical SAM protein [Fundidesulfovibrio agrisoli]|uniref:radical SAM protein n=1 Tax=Fundidesulfovibrio agrisoli TaxID=2922717 RepID=UPI001FABAB75|nr:radical SAM protein [Fundidesulfovibrio agrisoli]